MGFAKESTKKALKKRGSAYKDLIAEHASNTANLDPAGEYITFLGGVQVDTIHSICHRLGISESVTRGIYEEFVASEDVLPPYVMRGNQKLYPTAFLEPIVQAINSQLYSKVVVKSKQKAIVEKLRELEEKNPQILETIFELLSEIPR